MGPLFITLADIFSIMIPHIYFLPVVCLLFILSLRLDEDEE